MKKLYLITTKTKAHMKSTEETIHSIGRAKFRELTVGEIIKIIDKTAVAYNKEHITPSFIWKI